MNRVRRLLRRHCPRSLYLPLRSYYNSRKRSVSQLGQDFWIFGEAFNEKVGGFFLEVGAADGITFSNTFLLEKRYGWRGICIEPNPALFEDLRSVRKVTCLNVCVDAEQREVEFALRGMVGGILDEDTDNTREQVGTEASTTIVRIRAHGLDAILRAESAPATIDYLSIDAEGAEDRILSRFPFDEYRFRCLTVERPRERLRRQLSRHDYLLIKDMPGLDSFFIHESFQERYTENVFKFWEKHRNR